jgi:hypothetical protein
MSEPLMLQVIDYNETREIREIRPTYEMDGRVSNLEPVKNSERAFLSLQIPDGPVVKVEVRHEDFEKHLMPDLQKTATG